MQKLAESAVIAGERNGKIKARVGALTQRAKRRFGGRELQGLATNRARDEVGGREGIHASVTNGNRAETNERLGANTAVGWNENCSNRIERDAHRMTRRLKPHAGRQSVAADCNTCRN